MAKKPRYESSYAMNSLESMIVRLKEGGFACVYAGEKKEGMNIQISDFAMSFLKFDQCGDFKKVGNEDEVPERLKENAKFNLEHCGVVFGKIRYIDMPEIDPW